MFEGYQRLGSDENQAESEVAEDGGLMTTKKDAAVVTPVEDSSDGDVGLPGGGYAAQRYLFDRRQSTATPDGNCGSSTTASSTILSVHTNFLWQWREKVYHTSATNDDVNREVDARA